MKIAKSLLLAFAGFVVGYTIANTHFGVEEDVDDAPTKKIYYMRTDIKLASFEYQETTTWEANK